MYVIYILLGNTVSTTSVFLILAFLGLVRFPISLLPMSISNIADCLVAFQRIETFLALYELPVRIDNIISKEGNNIITRCNHKECILGSIRIHSGEFRWISNSILPILNDISLDIKPGELIGVIGNVGSG